MDLVQRIVHISDAIAVVVDDMSSPTILGIPSDISEVLKSLPKELDCSLDERNVLSHYLFTSNTSILSLVEMIKMEKNHPAIVEIRQLALVLMSALSERINWRLDEQAVSCILHSCRSIAKLDPVAASKRKALDVAALIVTQNGERMPLEEQAVAFMGDYKTIGSAPSGVKAEYWVLLATFANSKMQCGANLRDDLVRCVTSAYERLHKEIVAAEFELVAVAGIFRSLRLVLESLTDSIVSEVSRDVASVIEQARDGLMTRMDPVFAACELLDHPTQRLPMLIAQDLQFAHHLVSSMISLALKSVTARKRVHEAILTLLGYIASTPLVESFWSRFREDLTLNIFKSTIDDPDSRKFAVLVGVRALGRLGSGVSPAVRLEAAVSITEAWKTAEAIVGPSYVVHFISTVSALLDRNVIPAECEVFIQSLFDSFQGSLAAQQSLYSAALIRIAETVTIGLLERLITRAFQTCFINESVSLRFSAVLVDAVRDSHNEHLSLAIGSVLERLAALSIRDILAADRSVINADAIQALVDWQSNEYLQSSLFRLSQLMVSLTNVGADFSSCRQGIAQHCAEAMRGSGLYKPPSGLFKLLRVCLDGATSDEVDIWSKILSRVTGVAVTQMASGSDRVEALSTVMRGSKYLPEDVLKQALKVSLAEGVNSLQLAKDAIHIIAVNATSDLVDLAPEIAVFIPDEEVGNDALEIFGKDYRFRDFIDKDTLNRPVLKQVKADSLSTSITGLPCRLDLLLIATDLSSSVTNATDRQSRVRAAEGLRVLTLIWVGQLNSKLGNASTATVANEAAIELTHLLALIIPAALSSDPAVTEMFDLVCRQVIRWGSTRGLTGSEPCRSFFIAECSNTLLPNKASFAAHLLVEALVWSTEPSPVISGLVRLLALPHAKGLSSASLVMINTHQRKPELFANVTGLVDSVIDSLEHADNTAPEYSIVVQRCEEICLSFARPELKSLKKRVISSPNIDCVRLCLSAMKESELQDLLGSEDLMRARPIAWLQSTVEYRDVRLPPVDNLSAILSQSAQVNPELVCLWITNHSERVCLGALQKSAAAILVSIAFKTMAVAHACEALHAIKVADIDSVISEVLASDELGEASRIVNNVEYLVDHGFKVSNDTVALITSKIDSDQVNLLMRARLLVGDIGCFGENDCKRFITANGIAERLLSILKRDDSLSLEVTCRYLEDIVHSGFAQANSAQFLWGLFTDNYSAGVIADGEPVTRKARTAWSSGVTASFWICLNKLYDVAKDLTLSKDVQNCLVSLIKQTLDPRSLFEPRTRRICISVGVPILAAWGDIPECTSVIDYASGHYFPLTSQELVAKRGDYYKAYCEILEGVLLASLRALAFCPPSLILGTWLRRSLAEQRGHLEIRIIDRFNKALLDKCSTAVDRTCELLCWVVRESDEYLFDWFALPVLWRTSVECGMIVWAKLWPDISQQLKVAGDLTSEKQRMLFGMLEVFYCRLPYSLLKDRLANDLGVSDFSLINKDVIVACRATLSSGAEVKAKIRAFGCMSACVCATQSRDKLYAQLLLDPANWPKDPSVDTADADKLGLSACDTSFKEKERLGYSFATHARLRRTRREDSEEFDEAWALTARTDSNALASENPLLSAARNIATQTLLPLKYNKSLSQTATSLLTQHMTTQDEDSSRLDGLDPTGAAVMSALSGKVVQFRDSGIHDVLTEWLETEPLQNSHLGSLLHVIMRTLEVCNVRFSTQEHDCYTNLKSPIPSTSRSLSFVTLRLFTLRPHLYTPDSSTFKLIGGLVMSGSLNTSRCFNYLFRDVLSVLARQWPSVDSIEEAVADDLIARCLLISPHPEAHWQRVHTGIIKQLLIAWCPRRCEWDHVRKQLLAANPNWREVYRGQGMRNVSLLMKHCPYLEIPESILNATLLCFEGSVKNKEGIDKSFITFAASVLGMLVHRFQRSDELASVVERCAEQLASVPSEGTGILATTAIAAACVECDSLLVFGSVGSSGNRLYARLVTNLSEVRHISRVVKGSLLKLTETFKALANVPDADAASLVDVGNIVKTAGWSVIVARLLSTEQMPVFFAFLTSFPPPVTDLVDILKLSTACANLADPLILLSLKVCPDSIPDDVLGYVVSFIPFASASTKQLITSVFSKVSVEQRLARCIRAMNCSTLFAGAVIILFGLIDDTKRLFPLAQRQEASDEQILDLEQCQRSGTIKIPESIRLGLSQIGIDAATVAQTLSLTDRNVSYRAAEAGESRPSSQFARGNIGEARSKAIISRDYKRKAEELETERVRQSALSLDLVTFSNSKLVIHDLPDISAVTIGTLVNIVSDPLLDTNISASVFAALIVETCTASPASEEIFNALCTLSCETKSSSTSLWAHSIFTRLMVIPDSGLLEAFSKAAIASFSVTSASWVIEHWMTLHLSRPDCLRALGCLYQSLGADVPLKLCMQESTGIPQLQEFLAAAQFEKILDNAGSSMTIEVLQAALASSYPTEVFENAKTEPYPSLLGAHCRALISASRHLGTHQVSIEISRLWSVISSPFARSLLLKIVSLLPAANPSYNGLSPNDHWSHMLSLACIGLVPEDMKYKVIKTLIRQGCLPLAQTLSESAAFVSVSAVQRFKIQVALRLGFGSSSAEVHDWLAETVQWTMLSKDDFISLKCESAKLQMQVDARAALATLTRLNTTTDASSTLVVRTLSSLLEEGDISLSGRFVKAVSGILSSPDTREKTLRLGSSFMPKVVNLLLQSPHLINKDDVLVIPLVCWLPWLNQLMSGLSTPDDCDIIQAVIANLSSSHPHETLLALNVAFEAYCLSASTTDAGLARFDAVKSNVLKEPTSHVLLKLTTSLEHLTHPLLRLKSWSKNLARAACASGKMKLIESFMSINARDSSELGELNSLVAKELGKMIKKPSDVSSDMITKAMTVIDKLTVVIGRTRVKLCEAYKSGFAEVRIFSTWLATTDFSKAKIKISTLGPRAPDDVFLLRIEPVMTVMESKQMPKRVTLIGSDDRRYYILVKGGEDVRLDQRVQQLFSIMREACPSAFSSLGTFKVVPLSVQLGLIEWLDNTITVSGAVNESLGINYQALQESKQRQSWLDSLGKDIPQAYSKLVSSQYTQNDIDSRYMSHATERLARSLRDFLFNRAESLDTFMASRVNFLTSLASFNAAAYILGIGDRHLNNFLICTKTGSVIGIDFGYSFGAGLLLPVPELMPMRLTPAFVGVGQPLSGPLASGHFREALERSLAGLRSCSRDIIAACDLFLREPLTDWSNDAASIEARIDVVKQKLDGRHPGEIMLLELQGNKTEWIKTMLRSKRSWLQELLRCNSDNMAPLTVSDQVTELINLSTSSNILGRTWQGWSPYI